MSTSVGRRAAAPEVASACTSHRPRRDLNTQFHQQLVGDLSRTRRFDPARIIASCLRRTRFSARIALDERRNEPSSLKRSEATPTNARASGNMCSSCQSRPAFAGIRYRRTGGANYCAPQVRHDRRQARPPAHLDPTCGSDLHGGQRHGPRPRRFDPGGAPRPIDRHTPFPVASPKLPGKLSTGEGTPELGRGVKRGRA